MPREQVDRERDRRMLRVIAAGKTVTDVAKTENISVPTASKALTRIRRERDCETMAQLMFQMGRATGRAEAEREQEGATRAIIAELEKSAAIVDFPEHDETMHTRGTT